MVAQFDSRQRLIMAFGIVSQSGGEQRKAQPFAARVQEAEAVGQILDSASCAHSPAGREAVSAPAL